MGGLLAFLVGSAVAFINYRMSLTAMRRKASSLVYLSVARQLMNIGTLAAAYLLSKVLPWGAVSLLTGAALGLTVPSVLLSLRLAKLDDARPAPAADGQEKEEEQDG